MSQVTTDMFNLSKHQMQNIINVSLAFLAYKGTAYVFKPTLCFDRVVLLNLKILFSVSRTSFYLFVVLSFWYCQFTATYVFIGLIFPLKSLLSSSRTNKLIFSCHSFHRYRWVATLTVCIYSFVLWTSMNNLVNLETLQNILIKHSFE